VDPLDHAHNARMDRDRYNRRSMNGTVFSSIERTHGGAERARSWLYSSVWNR
jgi:IS5 family transposase